jgi:hypothetical protein
MSACWVRRLLVLGFERFHFEDLRSHPLPRAILRGTGALELVSGPRRRVDEALQLRRRRCSHKYVFECWQQPQL